MDPFTILPQERARYVEQFNSLKPEGGFVRGEKAKGFMLLSQLPPVTLGHIWELADLNSDGKLDFTEFSIACKLINAKLRGFEVPKVLPPTLRSSAALAPGAAVITPPGMVPGIVPQPLVNPTIQPMAPLQAVPQAMAMPPMAAPQPMAMPPMAAPQPMAMPSMVAPMAPAMMPMQPLANPAIPTNLPLMAQANQGSNIPLMSTMTSGFTSPPLATATLIDTSKPNTPDSIKTLSKANSVVSNPSTEWQVPHQSKLKYTQLFNSHDRGKTGFLTGVQARGILVQTQLPQQLLAKIWGLADVDVDGRLSCDEFVLAMHLCDVARCGEKLPDALPQELVPPSMRRPSLVSIAGGAQGVTSPKQADAANAVPLLTPVMDDSKMIPVSFEDKRKENFDKGQAELDKRRRALAEQQRREQEERERKEREEHERREKIRLEQERRHQAELEKKLAKQREIEMEKEEQRRKLVEQREAARREMERQRQLEWQKQRLQELLQQKAKEQEKVALLRSNQQRLRAELDVLDDKVIDLSSKIVETRTQVAEAKSTIDGMRSTRDTQMAQLGALKTQLREQNARLLLVSQEKVRLEAKNRMNASATPDSTEIVNSIAARQLALSQQKEKLDLLMEELNKKLEDAENNNSTLLALKTEVSTLAKSCEESHKRYSKKRDEVLTLRATGGTSKAPSSWADDAWSQPELRISATTATTVGATVEAGSPNAGIVRYRALYEFVARNGDEISFQPGDIIMVTESLSNEPGWLSGEIRGHVGWFPEAYVEKMDQWSTSEGSAVEPVPVSSAIAIIDPTTIAKRQQLEGIQELPENVSDSGSIADAMANAAAMATQSAVVEPLAQSAFVPVASHVADAFQAEAFQTTEARVASPSGDDVYVAMYPYESTEPGDLTFVAGEMVTVTKKDGDWWTGTIGVRTGVFPSNYVQKAELQYEAAADSEVEAATAAGEAAAEAIQSFADLGASGGKRPNTAPVDSEIEMGNYGMPRAASAASGTSSPSYMKSSKKPEIATVIAPYTATSTEQLSLQRGQLIMIRKKSASGWWEGELQAKGRKRQLGWFPASYVKVLSSSGASSRTTPVPNEMEDDQLDKIQASIQKLAESESANVSVEASSQDQVVALFPYTAQNEDELSFLQGDVITIVDRDDPSWWRGKLRDQVGLFPSNYVEVMGSLAAAAALGAAASSAQSNCDGQNGGVLATLPAPEQTRQIAIRELISTEESYMKDLHAVTEVFQKPLLESGILKPEDGDTIFVNWKDLIACNNTFLRALRIRRKMSHNGVIETIGDILVDHFPNMSPYIRFCSRQLSAAALIQQKHEKEPEFRALLKRCQTSPKVGGMPLTSFLLKPMQRITKYPLLIKKILQSTDVNHPDRLLLDEALSKAEELCTQVNEGVREQENSDRLEWLQRRVQTDGLEERLVFNSLTNMLGPRKLIHYGHLKKVKSNKELLGFVFNDFLMLATASKPLSSVNIQFLFENKNNLTLRMYRKPIFLRDLTVVPGHLEDGTSSEEGARFTIQAADRKLFLAVQTSADRILWLKKLEEARKSCLATERSVLQRQRSKQNEGNVCGRLLVMILEAESLQSSFNVRQRPPVGKLRLQLVEGSKLISCNRRGKSDTFCEVYLGSQEQRTKVVPNSLNPKWNASMQFLVKDIERDVLCITVLDRDYFSPNEFLGRTEIRLSDVHRDSKTYRGPLLKRLPLHEVETGEIVVKLDLQLFNRH